MYDFEYHRPSSLAEAARLLSGSEDAKLLAGGQTYIPTLKQRLAKPGIVIDLDGIGELRGIKEEAGGVTIGAMTTHGEVERSDVVKRMVPVIAEIAHLIGDPAVRSRGTIGGSISNNDPAADYPGAVLALGATVRTDRREIAGDDFFLGMFETALEADEIVTAVHFPRPERAKYMKFRHPASRYAMAGVLVAKLQGGAVRVAVTGAGPCAFRHAGLEEALARSFTPDAVEGVTIDPSNLNGDLHGSQEYRAHLVTVMARRAVEALV